MPRLKKKWLPYDVASFAARKAICRSRKEYLDWHDAHRPDLIPKYPHRVYREWTSWNDFLHTTNTFRRNLPGEFRPYWDSVRWVQSHARAAGINTFEKWLHWYDDGEVPKDIPKYPNNYYEEWKGRGWGVWLGKTVNDLVVGEQMSKAMIALANDRVSAKNVVYTVTVDGGIQELGEKLAAAQWSAFAVYEFDTERGENCNRVFKHYGTQGADGRGGWIIHDVHGLLFELDNMLVKVDMQEAAAAFGYKGAQRDDGAGKIEGEDPSAL